MELEKKTAEELTTPAAAVENVQDHSIATDTEKQEIGVYYRSMADIKSKQLKWLWPGVIAQGKVNLIAGHPGLGKSQAAIFIAATISNGGQWPTSGDHAEVGNVIILSAEDDPADTIKPRLEAAGFDPSKVFILDGVTDNDGKGDRFFSLERDLKKLASMIEKIGGASLVIIDPIAAYLGNTDSHKDADVRRIFTPLTKLCETYGVTVLCVGHLNKSEGKTAITRASGSMEFVAASRTAWYVVKDSVGSSKRLFLPAKNNLGSDTHGYGFKVVPVTLPDGIETSRVEWFDDRLSADLDALLSPAPETPSAVEDAKEFLKSVLSHGAMESEKIFAEAKGSGISKGSLRRAQKMLNIKAKKTAKGWEWHLLPTENKATMMLTTEDSDSLSTLNTLPDQT